MIDFKFSPSEQRVVDLMIRGQKPKAIAGATGLTYSTIVTYQKRIYAKSNTHSALELVTALGRAQRVASQAAAVDARGYIDNAQGDATVLVETSFLLRVAALGSP